LLHSVHLHLLWSHAAHGVRETHTHSTLLLSLHLLRLLLSHEGLLLKSGPLLHHCRVHCDARLAPDT
jgi:hypothetical protein